MSHPDPTFDETAEQEYEEYLAAQDALPAHKRDGYGEMIFELADIRRKQHREEVK